MSYIIPVKLNMFFDIFKIKIKKNPVCRESEAQPFTWRLVPCLLL
jgi:hypothetical protein